MELAQNDMVFCAGGVAESSYLVLSRLALTASSYRADRDGSFAYVRNGRDCRVGHSTIVGGFL